MLDNMYLCEYSPTEKGFRIEKLTEILHSNSVMIPLRCIQDYMPFSIAASYEDGVEICRVMHKTIEENGPRTIVFPK